MKNRLSWDSVYFNHLLLPEWFTLPTPTFHGQIYKPLMNPEVKLLVVVMPRGFAKTTILQGYVMQQVVHRKHPVIVYIGDTYTQAEMHTESMRCELEDNEKFLELYGPPAGKKWTASMWTTASGITMIPKGSGQSIRGLKVGKARPSLVIIDDPENDENTETPEQREKLWRYIYAVVKPMMQAGKKDVKIVYLGTPIHEDCVLLRLIDLLEQSPFCDDPAIEVVRLAARDDEGESIWPELWSTERLLAEEEFYAAAGQLDVFYREYLGEVIATKDAEFSKDDATYYCERDLPNDLQTYAALDVAFSKSRRSDFSSLVVVSTSVQTGNIYVRIAQRKRQKPDELLERLVLLNRTFCPYKWFVQNVVLDEFFQFYATEKATRINFQKVSISRQKNAKVRRISSLQPLYGSGRLQFLKSQSDLLAELWSHPRAKHDDLADPLAGLIGQLRIPLFTPRVVNKNEFGSLEYIEEGLRRRRLAKRFGLTYLPNRRVSNAT